MEERRRSKRMGLKSKLLMKSLNDIGSQHEIEIEIVDVSKSGIGFISDKPLMIGTVYEAHLTIWTKETIHVFLEIVRIEKRDNDYSYGATFVGMPGMDASRISLYEMISEELEKQKQKG